MKHIIRALVFSALAGFAQAQTYTVKATAYNALSAQTDSTPHITSTGARAQGNIVALSRDLLAVVPYGSLVRLEGVKGPGCRGWATGPLRVEDTMARRKVRQADVLLSSRQAALRWGSCTARLVVIRLARR